MFKKEPSNWKRTPQFILLGDSHIQYTSYVSNGGFQFGAGLAEQCIRRFDIVNRGYSGYNSSQILKILPQLIPPTAYATVDYLLVLLGSNDSCLPTSPTCQHVPLETYKSNIRKIITHPMVANHHPTILLVTPPPVHEVHLEDEDIKKGHLSLTRHQSVTAKYAEAIRELVEEFQGHNVLLVDLWAAMMKEGARLTPGFVEGEGGSILGTRAKGDSWGLRSLLIDGLHLSGNGYALFLREVLPLVAPSLDERNQDHQPWVFPHWSCAPSITD